MNKRFLFGLFAVTLVALLAGFSSAYGYGDYKTEHYVKETYGWDGYTYVEKNVQNDPWTQVTTYKKVSDNSGCCHGYSYPKVRTYSMPSNKVFNYWSHGPNTGYSTTSSTKWKHYSAPYYADSNHPTSYYNYYYKPNYDYDAMNWYHRYDNRDCGQRCGGGYCC